MINKKLCLLRAILSMSFLLLTACDNNNSERKNDVTVRERDISISSSGATVLKKNPGCGSGFGHSVSISSNYALVGSLGGRTACLFDTKNGALLHIFQ